MRSRRRRPKRDALREVDAALKAFDDGTTFDAVQIARDGVFLILGQDWVAHVERGLIRPDDNRWRSPRRPPRARRRTRAMLQQELTSPRCQP